MLLPRFVAALDQSGGSTPGALDRYGVEYTEDNMFDIMHDFRLRMLTNRSFNSNHMFAVIVFKESLERGIKDILNAKGIRTYLKIDNGVEEDGSLKDMPIIDMLRMANEYQCAGVKMRSIIHSVDTVDYILEEQFSLAEIACSTGLRPIIEPEVLITNEDKDAIEHKLKERLTVYLDKLESEVWLKLTLPDTPNLYSTVERHEQCHRLLGLSGGYDLDTACEKLKLQNNMQASFSRALVEGLTYSMTDKEFHDTLALNIYKITHASSVIR